MHRTLKEIVADVDQLTKHAAKGDLSREEKAYLKKYIGRLNTHGTPDERYPSGRVLDVEYVERSGRMFAVGVSQQGMSNVSSAVCAKGVPGSVPKRISYDVDFVNCVVAM